MSMYDSLGRYRSGLFTQNLENSKLHRFVVSTLPEIAKRLSGSDATLAQHLLGIAQDDLVPIAVASFFEELVAARKHDSILDPAAGDYGSLAAWLAASYPQARIDAVSSWFTSRHDSFGFREGTLAISFGSLEDWAPTLTDKYDVIVSGMPLVQLRGEQRTYLAIDGTRLVLNDDPACLLIADIAERVSDEGVLALVLPPRFAWHRGPSSIRRNLHRFGLHLSALLAFRPGTYLGTAAAPVLAVIDRQPNEKLFVAEVPEDLGAQRELVERLWLRKKGKTQAQGVLVDERGFSGLPAFNAKERAALLAKSKGLEPVPFKQAVVEIRRPRRNGTDFARCEDHPDAVYLPEMASTSATIRQEDLPIGLKSYLQLIVNTQVVLPEFLAELLNTPLGHAMRQAVMTGVTIPRINSQLLRDSVVFLMPLVDQRRVRDAQNSIQRLRSELSELESRVWERPRQAANVIDALGKVNHQERFEEWVETLPFPLASILRSYHALDHTDKEKYERLLHFAESLAQFCSVIHLSAFSANDALWKPLRVQIEKALGNQRLSFVRASFGLWSTVAGLLAGQLRAMINGTGEQQAIALSLYGTADALPLEMLSSKDLVSRIQSLNNLRNRWTGHGGAVSATEAAERHEILKVELAGLREIIGTRFLQYQLVEPGDTEILEGPIFRCRVRRVMGSNPQLEHLTIDVTTLPKKGVLFFYNPSHDKLLELIPFVQVRDTPQPASYFYNRFEKGQSHLVSYSLSSQSEVLGNSQHLLRFVEEFTINDGQP